MPLPLLYYLFVILTVNLNCYTVTAEAIGLLILLRISENYSMK